MESDFVWVPSRLIATLIVLFLGSQAAAGQEIAAKDQVAIGNWFCMWRSGPDLGVEQQLRVARWSLYIAEQSITIMEERTLPDTSFARELQRAIGGTQSDQEAFCETVEVLTVQVAPQLLGLPRKVPYTGVRPPMSPLIDALMKVRICYGLRIFDRMSVDQVDAAVRLAAELNDMTDEQLAELLQRSVASPDTGRIADQKSADTQCSVVRNTARSLMGLDLKPPAHRPE